ncbi:UNVERIFIED_ORG: hypothetical protein DFS12_101908 [Chitinophaga ginsengisegetis]|jgi:hypothetical protein|nr:hypothetical protein [Chitinophaga ginsengisegetis]MDR6645667.1 hypothetical protein [Chitinophaga ginsengisegetis]MDR6651741.1 hypothetical protein [Chitinophaga ginsengisegetis]
MDKFALHQLANLQSQKLEYIWKPSEIDHSKLFKT